MFHCFKLRSLALRKLFIHSLFFCLSNRYQKNTFEFCCLKRPYASHNGARTDAVDDDDNDDDDDDDDNDDDDDDDDDDHDVTRLNE